jgi:diguanylate cyclase (GGDEF)-like protein
MSESFSELLRVDPLTGCKNYLGFLEALITEEERSLKRLSRYTINASLFSALFFVDMNDLRVLNEANGHAYGDSVLRWMGILLREESDSEVYRVGGDEFAILLNLETREGHLELVERIHKRMELEAKRFGFPNVAADTALIFLDQTPTSLDTLLLKMGEAMVKVKNKPNSHFMLFNATDFKIHPQAPETWKSDSDSDISFSVRWLSLNNVYQVLKMGVILDETQQAAYTDTISGMPNLNAAMLNLEKAIQNSIASSKPFSMMMIDGDNIRAYNSINYAAGDEMIRDMCAVYKENVRPSDFVARWRAGDEFIVILPDTSIEGAKIIGERFRLAVKEASQTWRFPITISIGIATYPIHGNNINSLIDKAETANKHAKDQGKDQVVLAD